MASEPPLDIESTGHRGHVQCLDQTDVGVGVQPLLAQEDQHRREGPLFGQQAGLLEHGGKLVHPGIGHRQKGQVA